MPLLCAHKVVNHPVDFEGLRNAVDFVANCVFAIIVFNQPTL